MRKDGLLKSILVLVCIMLASTFTYKAMTKDKKVDYVIELDKFNISDDNTNAQSTTIGINKALEYAKERGYKSVKLPKGHYAIDTSVTNPIILSDKENEWTHNRSGVIMKSDMKLYMDGATLEMIPTNSTHYSIFTISGCNNSKVIGGTILGDRYEHNYGMRINSSGDELESGSLDENTGLPIDDDTNVRTKDFIENFNGDNLPEKFVLSVLENTSRNTVDGGVRYIYCYDENEKYLGIAEGGNGFLSRTTLLPNTSKIKVAFKGEKRLDAKYYITTEDIYPTHEFGTGITITDSDNIEIRNVIIKDTTGDCIGTSAPPLNVTVDNVKIIDCTLENARRQGISLVATGENYLIQGCNIGKINGVDPQSGIDIEHYDYVKNVVIDDSTFYDNKKWDIINYNGWDIEIKNSKFNGGIASTYGYNMNIYNNEFKYNDETWLDKSFKGTLFSLNTDKTDDDGAYFKIYDNNIDGYTASGGNYTSGLSKSEFRNNSVKNSNMAIGANGYENSYTNSGIRYVLLDYEYKNEKFENCSISGENNGDGTKIRYYTNFEMINCEFGSGTPTVKDTVLTNCKIYNNDKTFCKTWSGKYTLNNCDIKTEYKTDISFIESQGVEATFNECDLDLAATPFIGLNYGDFIMKNCNVKFNDSYKGKSEEIDFFTNVYGTSNFENNSFDTSSINTTIILPN